MSSHSEFQHLCKGSCCLSCFYLFIFGSLSATIEEAGEAERDLIAGLIDAFSLWKALFIAYYSSVLNSLFCEIAFLRIFVLNLTSAGF
jgi:hypothetical protein